MFASTPGEVHRGSFCGPFRLSELIRARPRCIFGNGDDTESSRSGARSPEGQVNLTQGPEPEEVLRTKEHRANVLLTRVAAGRARRTRLPIPRVSEFPDSVSLRGRKVILDKPRATRWECRRRAGRAALLTDGPEFSAYVSALQSARTDRDRVTNTQDGHGVLSRRVQAGSAFNEPARMVTEENLIGDCAYWSIWRGHYARAKTKT